VLAQVDSECSLRVHAWVYDIYDVQRMTRGPHYCPPEMSTRLRCLAATVATPIYLRRPFHSYTSLASSRPLATMQVRPPNAQGGFPAVPYHPPVAPAIHPQIGQLIPRIRIAIQDIDVFQNMVAQGVIDSSMPSWYVYKPFCRIHAHIQGCAAPPIHHSHGSSERNIPKSLHTLHR